MGLNSFDAFVDLELFKMFSRVCPTVLERIIRMNGEENLLNYFSFNVIFSTDGYSLKQAILTLLMFARIL